MKVNFKFTVNKEIEIDNVEVSKNEKGEEIKITKKVKKLEPHNFFIAKPTRTLIEDSELYYSEIYWRCVKDHNIRPSIQLQKSYLNDDGVLSNEQKKEYNELNIIFFDKQAKYQQLNLKVDKTEEEKKEVAALLDEVIDLLNKIQTFENQMGNVLYQNTAENIARNRTATWWMLHLSYSGDINNAKPYFGNGNLASKLKVYDQIDEDEDQFQIEVCKKLLLAATLWYFNKAQTQEEFDLMLAMYNNSEMINATQVVEAITPSAPAPVVEPVATTA